MFDGFPLSYDDYAKQYEALKVQVKAKGFEFDDSEWTHAIYNSFFEANNRRNEILVEV